VARYLAYAAAAIAALERVGVETTSFVALLASAGLAVGLALQGSLSHFASGVLILVFRPFDLGHLVQVGGHLGWVEDIGIFATTLVTGDGLTITVPNASITAASIVNHTAKGVRRVAVDIGIASGVAPGPVLERLETVARRLPGLDPHLPVQAVVHHVGESWVTLRVFVWVGPDRLADAEASLRRMLYEELLAPAQDPG
jgi:small conductance mechanosensitive channel